MPTTIHLVRHAQGIHNISRDNEAIHDPDLTSLGEQQCARLKHKFPYHDKLTHLFSSPLRRALYTCLLSFGSLDPIASQDRPRLIALPELQEVSDSPCDTGSEPSSLEAEFGSLVDLSRLQVGWNSTSDWVSWDYKVDQLKERAKRARQVLRDILKDTGDDDHVVAVTHGAFVHFLTEDYHGIEPGQATGWKNTEFRSYHFAESAGNDSEVHLVETVESWQRRQAAAPRPTKEEQAELQHTYYRQLRPFLDATVN
ncbi:phosphoglycerate mutase [Xylariaceae sp. FL0662B]|nr:phosphoglycerate mutase [Xylariaceae sp. FL0662B]